MTSENKDCCGEELDLSPGTWQQILDSFYGTKQGTGKPVETKPVCEAPDQLLPQRIIGIDTELIDQDAYRDFMRGL